MICTTEVSAHVVVDCDECPNALDDWYDGQTEEECEEEAANLAARDGWLISDDTCLCPYHASHPAENIPASELADQPGYNSQGSLAVMSAVYGADWKKQIKHGDRKEPK